MVSYLIFNSLSQFEFIVVYSERGVLLFCPEFLSDSAIPWTVACQASLSFMISWGLLKFMSIESWCYLIISSSAAHFFCLQAFPAPVLSQWVSSSCQVVTVLEHQHLSFQRMFRVDFFQYWLVWSPCQPRDSQESSPAPQFESIKSLAFSLLYGPLFTSVYIYWKNHRFTIWTLVGKVKSLLFNSLFRFIIAFLPRNKCLLISWQQSLWFWNPRK